MAEGGSRQNKVFKAMNRPLTVLGAERRLFFVALIGVHPPDLHVAGPDGVEIIPLSKRQR